MVEDEKKSWMSCLGWGCVTVLVLSVLGVGGCVFVLYRGTAGAGTVTDRYLESVAGGRFEDAYSLLGSEYSSSHDLSSLVAFEQAARHELGLCESSRQRGLAMNHVDGRTKATMTYVLRCENGTTEVVFTVEKINDEWVIQGIRYGEAEEALTPTCSDCGTVLIPGARFCADCGAAVGAVEPSPNSEPVTAKEAD